MRLLWVAWEQRLLRDELGFEDGHGADVSPVVELSPGVVEDIDDLRLLVLLRVWLQVFGPIVARCEELVFDADEFVGGGWSVGFPGQLEDVVMDFQSHFRVLFIELRTGVRLDHRLLAVRRIGQVEVRAVEDEAEVVRFYLVMVWQDQVRVWTRSDFHLRLFVHLNHDAFDLARLSFIKRPFKHDVDVRFDLRDGDQVESLAVDHEVSGELNFFYWRDQILYIVVDDISLSPGGHVAVHVVDETLLAEVVVFDLESDGDEGSFVQQQVFGELADVAADVQSAA